jgi:hypothetical protein
MLSRASGCTRMVGQELPARPANQEGEKGPLSSDGMWERVVSEAESLQCLSVPASEAPAQQWERVRAITVDAVYTLVELLQPLIG